MEHFDDFVKCPNCGIINPFEAKFCRKCGSQISTANSIRQPYHIVHPDMKLKPYSEFDNLWFFTNKPDYVEDPQSNDFDSYLYIVKDGKVGILHWRFKYRQFWENISNFKRIIPCQYDKIVKRIERNMFECYNGNEIIYIDLHGNILK